MPQHSQQGLLHAQEQDKQKRIRGLDAQKANIQAARVITRILKTSLGPKGMDKMLQGPDGDICISAPESCVECG